MIDKIVVDSKSGKSNLYIEAKTVRSLDNVLSCLKARQLRLIGEKHGNFTSAYHMLSELKSYEHTKFRKFENSKYEARFGSIFNVMLPQTSKSWSDKTLLSVAKQLIAFIVGEEKNLGWIVFSMKRKNTIFLKIWISDRPFDEFYDAKRYNRDVYVSQKTHKFCKSTDVDAVLTHKKGDVVLDDEGKPQMFRIHFYPRKTRIFCYSSESEFVQFCEQLKKKLMMIIASLRGDIRVVEEAVFKRKRLKQIWNPYIRRMTAANNRARAFVQDGFNIASAEIKAMFPSKMLPCEFNSNEPVRVLPNDIFSALKAVFEKYTDIFRNDSFDYHGVELPLFGGSPSIVEESCNILMRMFEKDIQILHVEAAAIAAG